MVADNFSPTPDWHVGGCVQGSAKGACFVEAGGVLAGGREWGGGVHAEVSKVRGSTGTALTLVWVCVVGWLVSFLTG